MKSGCGDIAGGARASRAAKHCLSGRAGFASITLSAANLFRTPTMPQTGTAYGARSKPEGDGIFWQGCCRAFRLQQLLRRGHVARGAGRSLKRSEVGHATIDPSCTTTVARIARKGAGADCALLEPVNARASFVRKLIGSEPGANSHSVIGRFASRDGSTVVFVAGWRRAALTRAEIPCLVRAVRTVWETAHSLAPRPPDRHPDARNLAGRTGFSCLHRGRRSACS